VIGAEQAANRVGHDQADEADEAREADDRSGDGGGREEHAALEAGDVDAQMRGGLASQGE
jgi:hypothetical protein